MLKRTGSGGSNPPRPTPMAATGSSSAPRPTPKTRASPPSGLLPRSNTAPGGSLELQPVHSDAADAAERPRLGSLPTPSPQRPPAPHEMRPADVPAAIEHVAIELGHLGGAEMGRAIDRAFLEEQQRHSGATAADFNRFTAEPFVAWSPSASAGKSLSGLNDHAGVLVVAARDGNHTVAERLAVIKQPVDGEDRYFVKGYADRVVPFQAITDWVRNHQNVAPEPAAGVTPMETGLRTELRRLSEASELYARRGPLESDAALMNAPSDRAAMPRRATWANSEHFLPKGFGPIVPSGANGEGEPARTFFMDYNGIENRLLLFKRGDDALRRDVEAGFPTTVNIDGPVLAEIHGIRSIEILAPAGIEPGVKNATLKQVWDRLRGADAAGERVLHVTTEDKALHELRLSDRGVEMKLLNPKPSLGHAAAATAFGGRGVGADVDVYSYHGIDTGPPGSADGFADPKLVLSSGESLAAGPLVHNQAHPAQGNLTSLMHAAARLATFTPKVGGDRSRIFKVIDTAVVATTKALVVAGSNAVLQTLQKMHDDGTLFGGGQSFSGVGSGRVDNQQLAGAIFYMVLAQQGLTTAFDLVDRAVKPLLPHALTARTNRASTVIMDMAVPMVQEMARLSVNYGIQRKVDLPRGGGADVGMLVPQSAVSALVEFTRRRAGEPQSHPKSHAALALLDVANDTAFRSLGAVLSSKDYQRDRLAVDLREALVSRLIVRGGDKLVLPLVATALNEAGVIGPNASAFDHQDARESGGLSNVVGLLKFLADKAAVKTADAVEAPALRLLDGMAEGLRGVHIKFHHWALPSKGALIHEVAAARRATAHPRLDADAQRGVIDDLEERLEGMIERARAGEQPAVVINARSELPPGHRDFMNELDAGQPADPERRYRAFSDATGRARPSYAQPGLQRTLKLHDTSKVPRDATTFSLSAQHFAKPPHDVMESVPGMASIRDVPALSKEVRKHIESAVRDYTEESQFFHYPLRWEVTGQPQRVQLAPGIDLGYRVMNKPGNTDGDPTKRFDPIGAIYVNLGALHAEKYPALVQRAVGTEARYGVPLERPTQPRTELVQNDDVVALTEILSATTSSRLAAAFGQSLAFGAMRKDRSQRMVMLEQSAVNITRYTDLVQAEVIAMPGGLFRVRHIDADPRKPEHDTSPDIGQVVYMQAVDTAALERNHPAYYGPGQQPPALNDGDLAIHPHTGHLYRWDADTGRLRYADLEKNYFLGRPMERTRTATAEDAHRMPDVEVGDVLPANELALWRHPYTADGAKRATKDAIHAAIVRGDPIVEHLDDAVLNVHHQHFRDLGGFRASHAHVEEVRTRATTRATAMQLSHDLNQLNMDSPLPAEGGAGGISHQTLAWLATSLLRRGIQLVPVIPPQEPGAPHTVDAEHPALVATTYDKVNLAFERPVAVGVGPDGFYALRQVQGRMQPQKMEANTAGATVGNFLHAVVNAGFEEAGSYRATEGARLTPDRSARRGANKVLEKIKALAATHYHPLEKAMVEEARRNGWQPPREQPAG